MTIQTRLTPAVPRQLEKVALAGASIALTAVFLFAVAGLVSALP